MSLQTKIQCPRHCESWSQDNRQERQGCWATCQAHPETSTIHPTFHVSRGSLLGHNRYLHMGEERSAASGLSESEYESDNPDHMIDNTTICPFVFSTYFDDDLKRWFIPKQGNGNAEHCGHSHIAPHLIRLRTDVVLDEDERQLTRDAQSSRISSVAARNIMFTRTSQHLEWSQIHHLYKRDKAQLLITQGLTDPS